jgi:methyl-accepting chemotaxis protein
MCSVLPLLSISTLSFYEAKSALSKRINANITGQSKDILTNLIKQLDDSLADLESWSHLGSMQDVLTDDEDGELSKELKQLQKRYLIYSDLIVLNDQGIAIASSSSSLNGKNLSEHQAFRTAKELTTYVGTVNSKGLITSQAELLLALPIRADYDADTMIGVLVGVIDWKLVQQQLSLLNVEGEAQDKNHRLLVIDSMNQKSLFESLTPAIEKLERKADFLPGAGQVISVNWEGQTYLVAGAKLDKGQGLSQRDWAVYLFLGIEDAYAGVFKLRNNSGIITLIVALIVLIIGYFIAKQLTRPIHEMSERLTDSTERFSLVSEDTHNAVLKQNQNTKMVTAAIQQLAKSIHEVAANASSAADAANQVQSQIFIGEKDIADNSNVMQHHADELQAASDVIQSLHEESNNIGGVLNVIGGIANNTNILALNASIEAARAGQMGKGFAVVAGEIRSLASLTQGAILEIQELVGRLQLKANQACEVMEDGRQRANESLTYSSRLKESFDILNDSVTKTLDMNTCIATLTEEQSGMTSSINQNLSDIHVQSLVTDSGAQKIGQEIDMLSDQVGVLQSLILKSKKINRTST